MASNDNDKWTDDGLNPASDLYDAENRAAEAVPGYGQPAHDAPGQTESTSTPGQESAQDTINNQEQGAGGWSYESSKNPLGNKSTGNIKGNLKKFGPAGLLVSLVAGLGIFASILSPSILPVHLKEIMVEKFGDQLTSMDYRSKAVLRNKLKSKTTTGICSPISLRCKYRTMSDKQLKNLGKAGIKIDYEETITGRVKPKSFEFDGKSMNADEIYKEAANNPKLRSALQKGYNPKFAAFADKVATKFSSLKKISRAAVFGGNKPDDMKGQLTKASGGDGSVKVKAGSDADGDVNKAANELDDEIKAKKALNDVEGKAAKGATKGVLTSVALGLGVIDNACTGYNLIRTVGSASKYIGALQLMRYATVFMNTADKIKAGDATPEEVEFIGNILTSTNSQGKSATDSYGYHYAAYGDYANMPSMTGLGEGIDLNSQGLSDEDAEKALLADEVLRYKNGQLIGNDVMASIISWIGEVGGNNIQAADKNCGFVKSMGGQAILIGAAVAGVVVGIMSGGTTIGAGAVVQAAVGVSVGIAISLATPKLVDMAAGTLITGEENGNQAGNAIVSGMGAYNAQSSQYRGLAALTKDQVIAYGNKTSEVLAEYAEVDRLELSPFDTSSRHTFMGNIAHQVLPYISGIKNKNTPLSIISFVSNSLISPLQQKQSVGAFSAGEFDVCQDADYEMYNLAADPFCNLRYGIDPDLLETDPEEVLNFMESGGYIDNQGTPKGEYAKYITNCIERTTPIGGLNEDEPDIDGGEICIQGNDRKYDMFRLFHIDQGVIEGMDDDYGINTTQQTFSDRVFNGEFMFPLKQSDAGTLNLASCFGWRNIRNGTPWHPAIDIGTVGKKGVPVYAAGSGVVTTAGSKGGYGNFIAIKHKDDLYTHYAHLASIGVEVGQQIQIGQQIGIVGNTGGDYAIHLDFGFSTDGNGSTKPDAGTAINPFKYITVPTDIVNYNKCRVDVDDYR